MALIDWIPFVSTIKHAAQLNNLPGSKVEDYICPMKNIDCGTAFQAAAIAACEDNINKQALKYIDDFSGGNILDSVMHDAVGDIIGIAIGLALKKTVTRLAGLSIPILGAVLVADSFLDLGLVITGLNNIRKAATRAKELCCKCAEVQCPQNKLASGLMLSGWYFFEGRSGLYVTQKAQEEVNTNKSYNCGGNCETGHCLPTAIVTKFEQSGWGIVKTTVTYDVYCVCR